MSMHDYAAHRSPDAEDLGVTRTESPEPTSPTRSQLWGHVNYPTQHDASEQSAQQDIVKRPISFWTKTPTVDTEVISHPSQISSNHLRYHYSPTSPHPSREDMEYASNEQIKACPTCDCPVRFTDLEDHVNTCGKGMAHVSGKGSGAHWEDEEITQFIKQRARPSTPVIIPTEPASSEHSSSESYIPVDPHAYQPPCSPPVHPSKQDMELVANERLRACANCGNYVRFTDKKRHRCKPGSKQGGSTSTPFTGIT